MCESIQRERGEMLHVHQDRVGSQHQSAKPGTLRGDKGEGKHQRHGANKEMPVDGKERCIGTGVK